MPNRSLICDAELNPMFDEQAALLQRLFERRHVEMIGNIRRERSEIAESMSVMNMLQSGAFVTQVTEACVERYELFAHRLIKEAFDLWQRSGAQVDVESAQWMRDNVGHFLKVGARTVGREGKRGQVLAEEFKHSVDRAMEQSLNRMRRDLEIEIDLTLATKPAAPANAAEVADAALIDPLVGLQNSRGLETGIWRDDAESRRTTMRRDVRY